MHIEPKQVHCRLSTTMMSPTKAICDGQRFWQHYVTVTFHPIVPMPSNTPSTDAAHQAASGSTQAANALRKVNMCKYLPIGSIIILPDDVYKSSKIMLPKEGLCL